MHKAAPLASVGEEIFGRQLCQFLFGEVNSQTRTLHTFFEHIKIWYKLFLTD